MIEHYIFIAHTYKGTHFCIDAQGHCAQPGQSSSQVWAGDLNGAADELARRGDLIPSEIESTIRFIETKQVA